MLSQRLTELQEAGIVARDHTGDYMLTSEGQDLLHALTPLQDWAYRWAIREDGATGKYPDPPSLQ